MLIRDEKKTSYCLVSLLQIHDWVGDAISRRERKQPLQLVSLSKLCANVKMGMWELIITHCIICTLLTLFSYLFLISSYMSMNVFV